MVIKIILAFSYNQVHCYMNTYPFVEFTTSHEVYHEQVNDSSIIGS
jgi:hypothetical protein